MYRLQHAVGRAHILLVERDGVPISGVPDPVDSEIFLAALPLAHACLQFAEERPTARKAVASGIAEQFGFDLAFEELAVGVAGQ